MAISMRGSCSNDIFGSPCARLAPVGNVARCQFWIGRIPRITRRKIHGDPACIMHAATLYFAYGLSMLDEVATIDFEVRLLGWSSGFNRSFSSSSGSELVLRRLMLKVLFWTKWNRNIDSRWTGLKSWTKDFWNNKMMYRFSHFVCERSLNGEIGKNFYYNKTT